MKTKSKTKVKLNSEKIKELMNVHFGDNYHKFAAELGVDVSHLHKFINSGIGGGSKIIFAIYKLCSERNFNFSEYIEQ